MAGLSSRPCNIDVTANSSQSAIPLPLGRRIGMSSDTPTSSHKQADRKSEEPIGQIEERLVGFIRMSGVRR